MYCLCVVLCDPLCLNELGLNTKGTKVFTKVHKGHFKLPSLKEFIW
jgi:hypothetical protein